MTDGLGSQSYSYDQLSRMTSETRTFNGLGSYAIGYQYNFANQLTSITDPFSAQVGYNHDDTGRVTGVTGSGFANISTYASNLQYRAWGALKYMDYWEQQTAFRKNHREVLASLEGQTRRCGMKHISLTLGWSIKAMAIVLAIWNLSTAQDRSKPETAPQKTVLRQLHPDPVENDPPRGVRLLDGYKHKSATDFEGNQVGEISKSDGVKIKYEIGFSQGMAVDADQKATYVWYREQKMNGRIARYALSKINILAISIPLDDDPNTLHVANFYGTIRRPEDIIDMLLMISPFAFK